MAVLHPQECYLLEKFISVDNYAATRDAIIGFIDAHEAALSRYQQEMPLNSRNLPIWQQADIIWGDRVMPNIRDLREHFITRTIQRINNDSQAFSMGSAMSNIRKGIGEFWDGWMTDPEKTNVAKFEYLATTLDNRLSKTLRSGWNEGELTYDGIPGIYTIDDIPSKIPRYELDLNIRVEIDEIPTLAGIYLPDIDFAPARFIPSDYGQPASARQGIKRSDWVNPDTGKRDYNWKEAKWVRTGWTLIRRVEGEFIDVPREGFFPKGTPDELYNWPQREQELLKNNEVRITCWTGELAPYAGRWASTVGGTTQYVQIRDNQLMPEFEDKYGKKHRACWSLLDREDGGNVYILPGERS